MHTRLVCFLDDFQYQYFASDIYDYCFNVYRIIAHHIFKYKQKIRASIEDEERSSHSFRDQCERATVSAGHVIKP